jgi:anti-sigma factor RsiW
MNCKRVHRRLSAYLDGELPSRAALRLENHLSTCPSCQTQAERLRQVWHALSATGEIRPSPQFQSGVWNAIDAAATSPAAHWGPVVPRLGWALALAAVLFLGAALGRELALLPRYTLNAPPPLATAGPVEAFQEIPQDSLSAVFTRHLVQRGGG